MQMRFSSTVLFVSDIERSKAFYRDFLGQEVVRDGIFNVGFESGLSLYQTSADCALYCDFETAEENLPPEIRMLHTDAGKDAPADPEMELYFETDDILALADRVYEAGVPILHPVIEKPWGQRVFRFFDPDRHLIEVGEAMEEVVRRYAVARFSPQEIAQKTYLSVDAVTCILGGSD